MPELNFLKEFYWKTSHFPPLSSSAAFFRARKQEKCFEFLFIKTLKTSKMKMPSTKGEVEQRTLLGIAPIKTFSVFLGDLFSSLKGSWKMFWSEYLTIQWYLFRIWIVWRCLEWKLSNETGNRVHWKRGKSCENFFNFHKFKLLKYEAAGSQQIIH